MNALIIFLQSAIMQGIPLLYGATGEIITAQVSTKAFFLP